MNRVCPPCGTDFMNADEELDLVPYSEEQRPENRTPGNPGPIGGMWFCSEECRDEYKEENDG